MSPRKSKRTPGRRPAQPDTELEIRNAARTLFAERGYKATSIRAIAQAAEVDPALVLYYFTSKEDLFRQVLDAPFNPEAIVATVLAVEPENVPYQLALTMLRLWDEPETGLATISFMRRVVAEPATSELVKEFLVGSMLGQIAAALLKDVDPAETRIRVELVGSQMVGLMFLRKILKVEPLANLTPEEAAALVAPTIAHYLYGELQNTWD